MITVDPRRPIALDIQSFSRRPGTMDEGEFTFQAPGEIATEVMGVPAGTAMRVTVRLESVVDGILATGSIQTLAIGACVRCLSDVTLPLDEEYQELFLWPGTGGRRDHREGEEVEAEDEVRELDGDVLDLGPTVRDTLVPAMPFQPVCSPDCPGLCDQCGARLADDPDHHHDVIDPRWAQLAELASGSSDDKKKRI